MAINKIWKYQTLLKTYEALQWNDISRFNKEDLRAEARTHEQKDILESFCANIACHVASILEKIYSNDICWISSINSPPGEYHIWNEIFDILQVNDITTDESDWLQLFITLQLTQRIFDELNNSYDHIISIFPPQVEYQSNKKIVSII